MQISIDAAAQDAADSAAAPKRTRRPRKAALARELEAYQEGYGAGVASKEGGGVIVLAVGAIGGASLVGMAWTLVHFLG
jgi:hypothetical protein